MFWFTFLIKLQGFYDLVISWFERECITARTYAEPWHNWFFDMFMHADQLYARHYTLNVWLRSDKFMIVPLFLNETRMLYVITYSRAGAIN